MLVLLMQLFLAQISATRLPPPPVFTSTQTYPPICYLPPDSGLCEDGLKSENLLDVDLDTNYYFDAVTGNCYPFGVQNCGGNENRFVNQDECADFCTLRSKETQAYYRIQLAEVTG